MTVVEPVLRRFLPRSLRLCSTVSNDAETTRSNLGRHRVQGRHRRRIHEFLGCLLLTRNDGTVDTAHRHGRQSTILNRLKRILHLIKPAFRTKHGDVSIIPRRTTSRHDKELLHDVASPSCAVAPRGFYAAATTAKCRENPPTSEIRGKSRGRSDKKRVERARRSAPHSSSESTL